MSPEENRVCGTVKWFSNELGYGFVVKENPRAEVFLHAKNVRRNVRGHATFKPIPGMRVEFIIIDSEKGPYAGDVTHEANANP